MKCCSHACVPALTALAMALLLETWESEEDSSALMDWSAGDVGPEHCCSSAEGVGLADRMEWHQGPVLMLRTSQFHGWALLHQGGV